MAMSNQPLVIKDFSLRLFSVCLANTEGASQFCVETEVFFFLPSSFYQVSGVLIFWVPPPWWLHPSPRVISDPHHK